MWGRAMSLFPNRLDGYYDDEGNWQRTKYCFVSCGERCTCMPPGNLHYSVAHDKRVKQTSDKTTGKRDGS